MSYLEDETHNVLELSICYPKGVHVEYMKRIVQGDLCKEDNPQSHFCVYFLPYDLETRKIFIVHHKKSGLWLSPGGHIDRGESLLGAVKREIKEELGLDFNTETKQKPFLLTITDLPKRPNQTCRKHFDIWYRIKTRMENLQIDMSEFHDTKWLTVDEARELVIEEQNLEAIRRIEEEIFKKAQ